MGRRNVWVGALLAGAGVVGAGFAQPPASIPPADSPAQPVEVVAKVSAGTPRLNGGEMFPKMMAEAREAYSRTRDYAGHLIRQERVGGALRPEQAAEIRVRVKPHCVNVRVVKPDALRGEETSYMPDRVRTTVRFKPAGVEGVRNGFRTMPLDDPKAMANTRHPASEVDLVAVLDRLDKVMATEVKLGHPAAVVAAEYTFAGKPVVRYEVYCEVPHPARYAHKCVVCVDPKTKLPVRFEAYDAPKGGSTQGELIESHSYVGLVFNTGLGDTAFVR